MEENRAATVRDSSVGDRKKEIEKKKSRRRKTYPASQTTVPLWKTTGFPDLSTSTPEIWPKSYSSNGQPSTSSGCEISSAIWKKEKLSEGCHSLWSFQLYVTSRPNILLALFQNSNQLAPMLKH